MEILPLPGFTEPVSSWLHLLAAGAAFVGIFYLWRKGRGNPVRIFSLCVFSFSLIFLFSMSGVYHLLDHGSGAREVLRRLDHAAIWILIAGTFTPIHIILFRGLSRWGILAVVWTIAITGLVLEVVFFESFPEWLILCFFLGLGWVGAFSGVKFKQAFKDPSFKYLLGGGLFYSVGACIDFLRWPMVWAGVVGPHEIFHVFVILGALFHWIFIYKWAHHPVANTIIFHIRVFPKQKFIAQAIGEPLEFRAHSLEELKKNIKEGVAQKFHESIQPVIHLRYFQEEHLEL